MIDDTEFSVERRETSQMIRSARHLFTTPPAWTSAWLDNQKLDRSLDEIEGQNLVIDIVYTWVNGSDPKLQAIKERYQEDSPFFKTFRSNPRNMFKASSGSSRDSDQTANRFRDMDELRYSIRSASQYANRLFSRIHILTTTVDDNTIESQIPSWLDMDKAKDVVELVPHEVIFESSSDLPSFNSLSIESQIHHIPNITDAFLYLNDDVFLGTTMLPSDVWTPLYGFVFHMEPTLLVPPTILDLAQDTLIIGEWNSLQYSNYLLSKQFGPRHRAYLAHVPHVLSAPVLKEIQTIWPEEFNETSSHRFRGEGQARDVQVSFFMAHYVLERQRETQLTSYWLHRLDANQDGVLDWSEREQLINRVEQWNKVQANNPFINNNFHSFLENNADHLRQLGFPPSGSSVYRLSGLDGYPFMLLRSNTSTTIQGASDKTYEAYDETKYRTCQFDIDFCLSPAFRNSTLEKIDAANSVGIFQRMAFQEFHCGDCLLHILRRTATESGLGSEILPLDKESNAYKTITVDMARYNYVIATSAYSFIQLQEPIESQTSLAQILSTKETEAFFCINDNVKDNPQTVDLVQMVFKKFLDERFPIPSPWEKPQ
ncbi:Xanthine phosphoribosyltransferase 1 [Mortierella sp. AM989]|nr:Xanthine phosphoribosyltransferase 1 [Mortierella sp. AM989]